VSFVQAADMLGAGDAVASAAALASGASGKSTAALEPGPDDASGAAELSGRFEGAADPVGADPAETVGEVPTPLAAGGPEAVDEPQEATSSETMARAVRRRMRSLRRGRRAVRPGGG
jgi:hypothetical protein